MGNNLCRERIARADNSKSPIDRIIGRCAQICPSNEGKSNYWPKHVLETEAPTRTQPQSTLNDGWRKVTLTVPNGKHNNDAMNIGETPVAPPRRKRSSVIDRQPCGFKELFGNNVSRRSSCDSILKDDNPLTEREQEMLQQKRKSKSISDFNLNESTTDGLSISTIRIPVTRTLSLMERAMVQQTTIPVPRPTLQRKISRVGNKKSDKFFGENLSDCLSDEPITPSPEPTSISFTYHTISTLITPISHAKSLDTKDKLDDFIDSNVNVPKANETNAQENNNDANQIPKRNESMHAADNDKESSLDKKAEFLMAMLEGDTIDAPIEESKIITPPRRSHLKKRNSNSTSNSNTNTNTNQSTTEKINDPDDTVESKIITTNNSEVKQKIENNNDEDYYKGMTPVDEPVIIPRQRPIKHICDDDEHMHKHKHVEHNHASVNENKENQPQPPMMTDEDIEKYIIMQVTNPPEKPKRVESNVLEKAKHVENVEKSPPPPLPASNHVENDAKAAIKPIPRVRHLSQENLMPTKVLVNKSNDTIDLLRIKSKQKANLDIDIDKFITDDGLQSILKKYKSQQSFFTQDLLSQIADRVYGFQDPFDTLDSCDDGSLKCTPHSKLTTRKVSVHRKESTVTPPILENALEISAIESAPKIVQMEEKQAIAKENVNGTDQLNNNIKETVGSQAQYKQPILNNEQTKRETENFISMERENSVVCDKTNEQINGHEDKQSIDLSIELHEMQPQPTFKQIDVANAENHVLVDIYKNNHTILDEFQKNFNGVASQMTNRMCDKSENFNSSDDDNTDSDITVKEVSVVAQSDIKAKSSPQKQLNGIEKRGITTEIDASYRKYKEFLEQPPFDSENNNGYDSSNVFPFGKSELHAVSGLIDGKTLTKNAEDILNKNIAKIELTSQHNGNANETPSTNDHSILLKYLK